jgi:hypothetical protein
MRARDTAFAFALLAASTAFAQSGTAAPRLGAIHGWTVDTAAVPLSGAQVSLKGMAEPVRTNERGEFRFVSLAAGDHVLLARLPGFSPETVSVTLEEGETLDVRITLRAIVAKLPETVVRSAALPARLDAFELRRQGKRVGGQFITREEITKRAPLVTTDLLRRMKGFKVIDSMGVSVAVSTRGPKPTLNRLNTPCVLRLGLDGRVHSALAINSIPPGDIHGIEIYTGANVPPEFSSGGRDSYCGLIMIWTR